MSSKLVWSPENPKSISSITFISTVKCFFSVLENYEMYLHIYSFMNFFKKPVPHGHLCGLHKFVLTCPFIFTPLYSLAAQHSIRTFHTQTMSYSFVILFDCSEQNILIFVHPTCGMQTRGLADPVWHLGFLSCVTC